MFRGKQHSYLFSVFRAAAIVGAFMGLTAVVSAQVTVTASTTFSGGLYQYDYSVTNNTIDDVLFVDVSVTPLPDTVQNLMAPTGFKAAFDSGLGLVTFLEDTDSFSSTPESGFTFDSPIAPFTAPYTATAFDPNFNEVFIPGQTIGPLAITPEPGAASLFAGCVIGGALVSLRRLWRRRRTA